MKKILVVSLLFIIGSVLNVWSQEDKLMKVAVFDPSSSVKGTIDEGTMIAVREMVSSVFVNSRLYSIVERSLLDKVIKEAIFTNDGLVDDNQAVELGKLAGADKVVLSVLTQAGTRNMLSIKLIDVKTATIEKQKTKFVNPAELLDVIEPLAYSLVHDTAMPNVRPSGNTSGGKKNESSTATSDRSAGGLIMRFIKGEKEKPAEENPAPRIHQPVAANNAPRTAAPANVKPPSGTRAPVVRSVMDLINKNLGGKVNRYRTDEERFEQVKSSGELKEFLRFGAKTITRPSEVDEKQVLFFCPGNPGRGKDDLLFLFMDGTMIGASTVLKGFDAVVVNDDAAHLITIWRGTSCILSSNMNFSQQTQFIYSWNEKNIQLQ